MGYTLRVMRIDFDRLMSIPGSRDARLLARLRPALEEVWDPDDIDEDEEPPLAMPPEALEQILAGKVPQQDWGGEPYYEAVAAIYDDLGTELDQLHLASCEMSHLQEVENALKDAGAVAPLSLLSLAHGGVPFKVPRGEPFPCLGYLAPNDVVEARRRYDHISLVGIPVGLRSTIENFAAWLKAAALHREGLVGILF